MLEEAMPAAVELEMQFRAIQTRAGGELHSRGTDPGGACGADRTAQAKLRGPIPQRGALVGGNAALDGGQCGGRLEIAKRVPVLTFEEFCRSL